MKNKKVIKVEADVTKPVLHLIIDSVNNFLTELMDNLPYTYYVIVIVGNNHPEMITVPIEKVFTGNGPIIDIPASLKNKKV